MDKSSEVNLPHAPLRQGSAKSRCPGYIDGVQSQRGVALLSHSNKGRGAVKLAPLRRRSRGERAAVKLAPLRRRSRGERAAVKLAALCRHSRRRTIMSTPLSFQDIILRLLTYWKDQGCLVQQPYNVQVGAGTMNPATALRVLGPEPWNVVYVEPSIRPDDG